MQLATALEGRQGQVERRRTAAGLQGTQLKSAAHAHHFDVGDIRQVVVHHLEERVVAAAAVDVQRSDQLLERQLLMRLGAADCLLDRCQQVRHRLALIDAGAQHLSVDEEADQPLHFGPVAVGDRHPDPKVGLATVARQQHVEGGQQDHEHGDVVFSRHGAHLLGQLSVDAKLVTQATLARHGWARHVGRELQQGVLVTQLSPPVVELALLLARLQPLALPQGIVPVLNRQGRQAGLVPLLEGCVAAAEFVDEHVHRPAIGDDMVQRQQQHVLTLAQ
ncbi:hypothetical protein PS627_03863 [Pseudomonas fluorescens]|nr:hypothetical protein PS627_03863 [Pseudomonas fluorescens]